MVFQPNFGTWCCLLASCDPSCESNTTTPSCSTELHKLQHPRRDFPAPFSLNTIFIASTWRTQIKLSNLQEVVISGTVNFSKIIVMKGKCNKYWELHKQLLIFKADIQYRWYNHNLLITLARMQNINCQRWHYTPQNEDFYYKTVMGTGKFYYLNKRTKLLIRKCNYAKNSKQRRI